MHQKKYVEVVNRGRFPVDGDEHTLSAGLNGERAVMSGPASGGWECCGDAMACPLRVSCPNGGPDGPCRGSDRLDLTAR